MTVLPIVVAISGYVAYDSVKRRESKGKTMVRVILTILCAPLYLPYYLATRPLKEGEVREGGAGWNVLRNFALLWTAIMALATFWAIGTASQMSQGLHNNAEKTGAAIGTALGLGMYGVIWFFPMIGALVLGLILKKSSVIEKGPTRPLAEQDKKPERKAA